ncbi:unnamed protein product [Symbiodinium sp. CCMP2592]|nr:unnamed protein product [Symbiodinium sp. CCMP2592]
MDDTTVYADDFLFHWLVNNKSQLEQAFRNIAFVLETLKHFGMCPSPTKSAVLIGVRGAQTGSVLKQYVVKHPTRGRLLQLTTDHGNIDLPVVKQHPYLGAVLSYSSFEQLTLKERMRQSWSAFNRLLPALRSSGVSLSHRTLIWRTCVFTTLVHGLDSVGFASDGALKLHKHVVRQLRILSKAPSYITRERPEDLLARLRIEDPLQRLQHVVQQRLHTCEHNGMSQLQPEFVHKWWKHLHSSFQALKLDATYQEPTGSLHAPTRLVAVSARVVPQACPDCGCYFPNTRTLRIHRAQKHPTIVAAQRKAKRSYPEMRKDFMQHSQEGVPVCKHCKWAFTSWPSFCLHFEHNRCPIYHHHSPAQDQINACHALPLVPRAFHQAVFHETWQSLAAKVRQSDLNNCLLCGQWLAHRGYLSRHIKAQHAEVYHLHTTVLQWLRDRTTAVQSPCQFCGDDYKARHCSRLFSMAAEGSEGPLAELRMGAKQVAEQELMSAEAQAQLLSAMMNREPQTTRSPEPSRGSTRTSTPAPLESQTHETRENAARPEAMDLSNKDAKRQSETTAEQLETGRGKGRDKWARNNRASGGGWDRDHQPDQISINRAQENFVMFAQTQGMLSSVPELYKATQAWKLAKQEHPETLTLPLRAWLLKHWVDLMLQRMEAVMQSETSLQQAKDMLILDESCNVPYLEWNAKERKLQIKQDRDPMTLTQVLDLLKQMQVLVLQPLAVLRFHTTRELVQNMQSDVVPLMLQIGNRTAECHQLWNAFYRLSHSGACRVVATSLRGDRMGRSALAVAIQKLADEINASALALCWILDIGLPGDVEPLLPAMMRLMRWLCAQVRPVNLWNHIEWRTMHNNWSRPTRQHDIVEYLAYLRPHVHPTIRYGCWEARQLNDNAAPEYLDEGHTWPLYLPASLVEQAARHSEPLTLQHLIQQWTESQAGLHGLTSEPPVVLIQINRFHTAPSRRYKVALRVNPEPYIMLPQFVHPLNHAGSLELQYLRYCRAVVFVHEGPLPTEGHYRAILHDTRLGDFITDDNRAACRINLSESEHNQSNCYAFLYVRCPEML